jgi:thioredoxin 1
LNVDDNPDLAMKYNVMSIPTLLVFKGGEVEKRLVGAKSKGALLQELEEFLPTT